jgi:ABC-type branched-subunit amino acid transport system substrate-binding protein
MPLLMPCFDALYEQEIAEVGDKCLGIIGDDFYSPEIDTALNKQFVDTYVKKHGYRPAAGAAGSYTATTMFLEAVKATKGDTSKDAIINALHNIKFESPIGMVSMSSESPGMGIIDMHVCKIVKKDGGYVWGLLDKYPQIVADVPGK